MFGDTARPVAAAALLLLSLSACASIVSDNDSTTYISTEPDEARCDLHGQDFKRVVHTPDSITLPAEAAPIVVACKKEGFRTTTAELDTSMDGWIVGNLIFGGLIGVAIDAARGAGQKYPPQLQVILTPASFESGEERDRWFDERRATVEKKWETAISEVESKCARDKTELCGKKVDDIKAKRDKDLEALEHERETSVIVE